MCSVIILNVVMLNAVVLSVVMLNFMAPLLPLISVAYYATVITYDRKMFRTLVALHERMLPVATVTCIASAVSYV
jgi:hypothetical protein